MGLEREKSMSEDRSVARMKKWRGSEKKDHGKRVTENLDGKEEERAGSGKLGEVEEK